VSLDSHRLESQGRITAEYVAALALSESATLAEAATGVLRAMCEALGWDFGALWNADPSDELLRCVNTWHPPTFGALPVVGAVTPPPRPPPPLSGGRGISQAPSTDAASARTTNDRNARMCLHRPALG